MVTYDAGLLTFNFCACEETKVVKAGFFFHFSLRWITNILTHRKTVIQTLSGKTVQMRMLALSFAARICDTCTCKYLNHITGINNLA